VLSIVEELTEPTIANVLHGNTILNTEGNEKVFQAVHVYITSTKLFFSEGLGWVRDIHKRSTPTVRIL
jgi:hypothetical protein